MLQTLLMPVESADTSGSQLEREEVLLVAAGDSVPDKFIS